MTIAQFRGISLGLLLFTVFALSAAIWRDGMSPPQATNLGTGERHPTSLPVSQIPTSLIGPDQNKNNPFHASTMNLDCFAQSPPHTQTNDALLRLRGRLCAPGAARDLQILNRSNGFMATVFYSPLPSDGFTTDYIHLNPGPNLIEFQIANSPSQTIKMNVVYNKPQLVDKVTPPAQDHSPGNGNE